MRNIKIWHLPLSPSSSACREKFFPFLSSLPFSFVSVICSTFPVFSSWLGGGSPGVATLKIHHISSLLRGSFKYILILVKPVLILSDAIFLIFSESGNLSFVKSPWWKTVFFIDHRILWKWKKISQWESQNFLCFTEKHLWIPSVNIICPAHIGMRNDGIVTDSATQHTRWINFILALDFGSLSENLVSTNFSCLSPN